MGDGLIWKCNLCDSKNDSVWELLVREGPSCQKCGSSVRQRHLLFVLGRNLSLLSRLRLKKDSVIGLSDAPSIESLLTKDRRFTYTNTFFDEDPRLDVANVSTLWTDKASILISSDVLEHVFFPISKSIMGHLQILKPGGLLILTIPYSESMPNQEHYPWMTAYTAFKQENGVWGVRGITAQGEERIVPNPVFHGGPGNTLEMRLMNKNNLRGELLGAGFTDVVFHEEDIRKHGIRIQLAVITARKPK